VFILGVVGLLCQHHYVGENAIIFDIRRAFSRHFLPASWICDEVVNNVFQLSYA